MGCSLEVFAGIMQKNHCHTHQDLTRGWERGLEHKPRKKLSLPWMSFLFLVFLSAPIFNLMLTDRFECRSLQEANPVHKSPFLQQKGDLGVGGRWCRCWEPSSQWRPFTRLLWSSGLWDRSGRFCHSEECVSAGYEPKDALFVEKCFLIN